MWVRKIRLDANYDGVRAQCEARLGNARIRIQIDIGFGDVITPRPEPLVYPTLLDSEPPRLLGYTPETSIAEKFQAMILLDVANTRLKDFLDVWSLSKARTLNGVVLTEAIQATFRRRGTDPPAATPVAFTAAFYSSPDKQAQWKACLRKARVSSEVPQLATIVSEIAGLLMPVVNAVNTDQRFILIWPPGGPWQGIPFYNDSDQHNR